jgi:hypothetical protein
MMMMMMPGTARAFPTLLLLPKQEELERVALAEK